MGRPITPGSSKAPQPSLPSPDPVVLHFLVPWVALAQGGDITEIGLDNGLTGSASHHWPQMGWVAAPVSSAGMVLLQRPTETHSHILSSAELRFTAFSIPVP